MAVGRAKRIRRSSVLPAWSSLQAQALAHAHTCQVSTDGVGGHRQVLPPASLWPGCCPLSAPLQPQIKTSD